MKKKITTIKQTYPVDRKKEYEKNKKLRKQPAYDKKLKEFQNERKKQNLEKLNMTNKNKTDKLTFNSVVKKLSLPVFSILALNLFLGVIFSVTQPNYSNTTSKNIATNVASQQSNLATISTNAQQPQNAIELTKIALDKLNSAQNVSVVATGEINSFVKQRINLTKLYDGKTHFSQNITTGFKNAANRVYYDGDRVTMITGTNVNENSASFTSRQKNMSKSEFVNRFSLLPDMYLPYEINPLTISSASAVKQLPSGVKEYSLKLHPQLSTKNYSKNLKQLLKLNSEPLFTEVTLNIVLDENNNFKIVNINEEYKIKVLGFERNCVSNLTAQFNFTKPVVIPY